MFRWKVRHLIFIAIGIILIIFAIWNFVMVMVFGWKWANWTGFGEYYNPAGEYQRGKTLWDIIELLIMPIVVAFVAAFFTYLESKRTERRQKEEKLKQEHLDEMQRLENEDRFRESELQRYIDRISELLEKGLTDSAMLSSPQNIARGLTLISLRRLDGRRKAIMLKFLYETDLITKRNMTIKEEKNETEESQSESIIRVTVSPGVTRCLILLHDADFSDTSGVSLQIGASHLYGANFQRANFRYANFANSFLQKTHFEEADLESADFACCDLSYADMSNSNLKNAILYKANLTSAKLTNANLSGADLYNAILLKTDLCGANLTDTLGIDSSYLRTVTINEHTQISPKMRTVWEIVNEQLKTNNLQGIDLANIKIERKKQDIHYGYILLDNCNIDNANFAQSQLEMVSFKHSSLRNSIFCNSTLNNIIFYRADLTGANLSRSTIINSELWRANLKDTKIEDANLDTKSLFVWRIVNEGSSEQDLTGADLAGAFLVSVNLSSAILCGAILASANLQNANLTNANLTDANLDSVDLRGADLRNALFKNTNLAYAKIDETTLLSYAQIPEWSVHVESDLSSYLVSK